MSCCSMVGALCPSRFTSTVAIRLPSRSLAAMDAASQTDPSATSPSPSSTQMRRSLPSNRQACAMPTPTLRPCPRDPVATSTNGSVVGGWPSRSESIRRRLSSSSSAMYPTSDHAA